MTDSSRAEPPPGATTPSVAAPLATVPVAAVPVAAVPVAPAPADIRRRGSGAGIALDIQVERPSFCLKAKLSSSSAALGLFGPSGAGKSTLLRVIGGLEPRARGTVTFDGDTWLDGHRPIAPEQRGIGYVPQEGLLFPHLDVERNLMFGARRAQRRGLDTSALVESVCRVLEIGPLLHRPIGGLSGGERQRVALGRALISGPRLLLLDEPLAGLDWPLRRRVLPLLVRVRDVLGVPMILVSHEPSEIQALCPETVVLDGGRVVTQGPTDAVLSDPAVLPFAAAYGYESLLEARVAETPRADSGLVTLGASGQTLATPRTAAAPGSRLWVGIRAQDVILARGQPGTLSARNRLPARVVSVVAIESGWLVRCAIDDDITPIAALLTTVARDALDIVPGRTVTLVIKANACRLYDRAPADGTR